jgi:hypothetical protein
MSHRDIEAIGVETLNGMFTKADAQVVAAKEALADERIATAQVHATLAVYYATRAQTVVTAAAAKGRP